MSGTKKLSDIASKIAENPSDWVLVIGDNYFDERSAGHGEKILTLAKKHKGSVTVSQGFYRKVIKEGYAGIADELFGNVWNGTSFLDDFGWEEMERRKEYAHMFKQKDRVNIDYAKVDIRKLLEFFSGIILTVCRDESVEAFWENEQSMLVDENVWTPYSLVTSAKWNGWRKYSEESRYIQVEEYFDKEESNIFKLYGSCRNPHQMLLSREDFELYYPVEKNDQPSTKLLLQELFQNKNLFILGEDTYCMENYGLPFAPGISELLKKPAKFGMERYIYMEDKKPEGGWNSFHITPLAAEKNFNQEIQRFAEEILKKKQMNPKKRRAPEKITSSEAERLFWELYIRRAKDSVSEREMKILEQQLLRIDDEKTVYLLSAAANNQADFYDLKKNISLAKKNMEEKGQNPKDYKKVLLTILGDRLSEKSLELLRILSFYGDGEDVPLGFPLGFLQLLSKSNDELRTWKRAGFQLTNSAIYVRRHYRKHLHKRMEYADSIMQTAGINPNKNRMKNIIEEIEHQLDDSYFYPVDERYFKISELSNKDEENEEEKVRELFVKMFRKLLEILKEKQDGYNHIRSLLETEINTIIHKIGKLDTNDEDLEWKPELIYYLLRESRVIPKAPHVDGLIEQLDKLADKLEKRQDEINPCEIFYKIILVHQSKAVIKSQSSTVEEQNAALAECQEAERLLEEMRNTLKQQGTDLFPKKIFNQIVHLYLLESNIHGRRSTIVEMKRCKLDQATCIEQEKYLKEMKENLEKAEEILNERKETTGSSYEDLYADLNNHKGQYYFKRSQYYWENRNYRAGNKTIQDEETFNYDEALKHYENALRYYKKFPYQYLIQRADVMRNIADLYYRRAESEGNIETKRQCYEYLAEAYKLYRSNSDLHGIADVLQSMGNAENVNQKEDNTQAEKNIENTRSALSFYDASIGLYDMLGDQWSSAVAKRFKEGIIESRMKPANNAQQTPGL